MYAIIALQESVKVEWRIQIYVFTAFRPKANDLFFQ